MRIDAELPMGSMMHVHLNRCVYCGKEWRQGQNDWRIIQSADKKHSYKLIVTSCPECMERVGKNE